jgi:hypothetical protein
VLPNLMSGDSSAARSRPKLKVFSDRVSGPINQSKPDSGISHLLRENPTRLTSTLPCKFFLESLFEIKTGQVRAETDQTPLQRKSALFVLSRYLMPFASIRFAVLGEDYMQAVVAFSLQSPVECVSEESWPATEESFLMLEDSQADTESELNECYVNIRPHSLFLNTF